MLVTGLIAARERGGGALEEGCVPQGRWRRGRDALLDALADEPHERPLPVLEWHRPAAPMVRGVGFG